MSQLHVGCAIISAGQRGGPGMKSKVLIAQRKPGSHLGGYWEFPGGCLESGESMEQCLVREVREELGIRIQPRLFLGHCVHPYPDKDVKLYFYICDWIYGTPVKHDCHDFRWVEVTQLPKFRFPPADDEVIFELIRKRNLLSL